VPLQKIKITLLKFAPLLAFLVYGTWATFVNYWAHADNFILSGIAQGSYAFATTYLLKLSVLKIYQKLQQTRLALLYTFASSFILLVSIPTLIHLLANTKEIFYSILPGAIIGGVYLMLILKYEVKR
jgi:hypothetical protein